MSADRHRRSANLLIMPEIPLRRSGSHDTILRCIAEVRGENAKEVRRRSVSKITSSNQSRAHASLAGSGHRGWCRLCCIATNDELEFARQAGVDLAEGPVFGKPLRLERIPRTAILTRVTWHRCSKTHLQRMCPRWRPLARCQVARNRRPVDLHNNGGFPESDESACSPGSL